MTRYLLASVLLLAWALAPALSVGKISFSANFPLDETALLQASGLVTGSDYAPADVNAAIALMQAWLQANGHGAGKSERVAKARDDPALPRGEDEVLVAHELGHRRGDFRRDAGNKCCERVDAGRV